MKAKSIGQLAKEANVSVRTLRHYDNVGLLNPSHRSDNGYRFYSDTDSQRLHDILFYRSLGFSLSEIEQLLLSAFPDRYQRLLDQREKLRVHMERLQRMQIQLDKTLLRQSSETDKQKKVRKVMKQAAQFDVFDGFDPDQYETETKAKWGDTEAFKESARRTKSYSDEDWKRYRVQWNEQNQEMVKLMSAGVQADSSQARAIAEKMRLIVDQWFYPCSRDMHAQLGEMYVVDERFTATYDKIQPGLAVYIRDAARANQEYS